ncbi:MULTISPECIES: DUF4339 domain-containing protein [unclassified Pseudomonas]|uniref:DUF4339 domain-containing protein n=1 Tax=unclassified Pseudomonas TaxID=196821 RepID=UPI00244C136A|nr:MULTISPECIES: DUF4339 domain-containing protein [unclassified Pseudomonas]MDH0894865.1 DUF4339 domain-containing protein [Pseudomonas sp. GD03875]MDH1063937.1 DUF4339 domain-containing protein [Pseudomonas sp. GD03985]
MTEIYETENKWFYEDKGQRLGGIDEATMIAMIQSKKLGYGSLVWQKGFSDWKNLEDTTLRPHLESISPPPLAGKYISNSVIWILALAPILGYLLECFVAGIVYNGNESRALRTVANGHFIYITIALNIFLSFWDEKRLQKSGVNTDRFKGWVWLVPVYIFQRAKNLQHNLAYFITWVACFIFMVLASAGMESSIAADSPYGDGKTPQSIEEALSTPVYFND